jgi:hypothetical protein
MFSLTQLASCHSVNTRLKDIPDYMLIIVEYIRHISMSYAHEHSTNIADFNIPQLKLATFIHMFINVFKYSCMFCIIFKDVLQHLQMVINTVLLQVTKQHGYTAHNIFILNYNQHISYSGIYRFFGAVMFIAMLQYFQ